MTIPEVAWVVRSLWKFVTVDYKYTLCVNGIALHLLTLQLLVLCYDISLWTMRFSASTPLTNSSQTSDLIIV